MTKTSKVRTKLWTSKTWQIKMKISIICPSWIDFVKSHPLRGWNVTYHRMRTHLSNSTNSGHKMTVLTIILSQFQAWRRTTNNFICLWRNKTKIQVWNNWWYPAQKIRSIIITQILPHFTWKRHKVKVQWTNWKMPQIWTFKFLTQKTTRPMIWTFWLKSWM